ncbi:MAG: hypothetical protein LC733_09600 [Actinobacteria bacterium]|nr:hypothetical protein [Actinomycetota bacterium]
MDGVEAGAATYVQIPTYRDAELGPTLRSLYGKATHPDRLRVRVLWQYGPDDAIPADVLGLPNLEIEAVPVAESEGCNWARLRLQAAWRDEPYTLLLDSHHRFVSGWDDLSIGLLEQLRGQGVNKPLLTAYLPSYYPGRDPAGRRRRPFRIYPYAREEGVLTRLTSLPIQGWTMLEAPIPADFLSLHFILADGRFNHDVPLDPEIYFFGDEVITSLRAFAVGYELFHPHRVIGWHAYDRSSRVPHWEDHPDWAERHRRSLDRMRRTYRSPGPIPGTPSGSRTVADFESRVNLSLVLP